MSRATVYRACPAARTACWRRSSCYEVGRFFHEVDAELADAGDLRRPADPGRRRRRCASADHPALRTLLAQEPELHPARTSRSTGWAGCSPSPPSWPAPPRPLPARRGDRPTAEWGARLVLTYTHPPLRPGSTRTTAAPSAGWSTPTSSPPSPASRRPHHEHQRRDPRPGRGRRPRGDPRRSPTPTATRPSTRSRTTPRPSSPGTTRRAAARRSTASTRRPSARSGTARPTSRGTPTSTRRPWSSTTPRPTWAAWPVGVAPDAMAGTPFAKFGPEEWIQIGVESQNWTL